jgi:tetratricopeptide (TPR) repeat protein
MVIFLLLKSFCLEDFTCVKFDTKVVLKFIRADYPRCMRKLLLVLLPFFFVTLSAQEDTVKVSAEMTPEQVADQDYNKGLLALNNKDFTTAADLFSKCLAVKPNFDKALSNRAIAFSNLKRYNEALNDINLAIKASPENPDNHFNKSLIFWGMNLPDSQHVALDKALSLKGDHADAAYYKGLLSYKSGEFDKAIGYYNISIRSQPRNAYAFNDRASAKREKGDYAGAAEDYKKSIETDSSLVFVYNNLGSAYRLSKNYAAAIEAYNMALKRDPKYLIALTNRGIAHFENNNLKAAQADFEAILSVDSRNSFAYNNISSIAIKNKDYKKAKDLATRAIDLDPKNGPAYFNRGIARQMLREEEACCADWKKALEYGIEGARAYINASCLE